MVRGALFGTFCSQHLIVPDKYTYLEGLAYPCRGDLVHMIRLGHKGRSVQVKIWSNIKLSKKN